jgi:hypothetical protein
VFLEIPGHHQRHANLHQLGGLYGRHADVQPTPRAVADFAEQGHADEEQQAENVDRQGGAHQIMQRQIGDDPHEHQSHQNVRTLSRDTQPVSVAGTE